MTFAVHGMNGIENGPSLKVTLLSPNGMLPTRGSELAAGCDLFATEDVTIASLDNASIATDISISLPHGCYGRIAPRSGFALHHKIMVGAGVIDRDYEGAVKAVLFNMARTPYFIRKGDRIAQLICETIITPTICLNESAPIRRSGRGCAGFGSSGR